LILFGENFFKKTPLPQIKFTLSENEKQEIKIIFQKEKKSPTKILKFYQHLFKNKKSLICIKDEA